MEARPTEAEIPGDLLTIQQAALLPNVHPNTVRGWSDRGMLEAYRVGSRGDRRFARKDTDAVLKKQRPD